MVAKSTKATKKAAPRKKPASKKTAPKKASAKKSAELKSFKLAKGESFFEFKISRQTVYWTILIAFIIVMQLWILKVQLEVMNATDALNQQLVESIIRE